MRIILRQLYRSFSVVLFLAAALALSSCGSGESERLDEVPNVMLWAWERPEDLRFIDPESTGVAFLAQTITLKGDDLIRKGRRHPLRLPEGTYVMAVTRVETVKDPGRRAGLTNEQARRTADLIKRTLELPNVKAVQVDFDAVVSERPFYRSLLSQLRSSLPEDIPLSMTALASWCVGDRWIGGLPVDEAVPMAFEMGTDDAKIRAFLSAGNDWKEPVCRQSHGLLAGDGLAASLDGSRRVYFFKRSAWNDSDIARLNK